MQTVLVAGGAGFIGSTLCKSLLANNYKVLCVDNLITGNRENLEDLFQNSSFKFVEQDIMTQIQSSRPEDDQPLAEKLKIQKLEYIFHLASPASPNKESPRSYINYPVETLLVNSLGTYNLLELARRFNSKFLYASSSEIYGDPKITPQNETYFGNVNPNGIRSPYDEGKRFGEAMTASYVRKYKVDARIIRIFNTYGPNMQKDDGRVVSNFIVEALSQKPITIYGDGKQTRSFCYIQDMVEGLKLAMFSDRTRGEVINLGNPDEKSILELARLIKELTKSNSQTIFKDLPEDDPKIRKPDIDKAKRLLNWVPKVSVKEGLMKTIDFFRKR